MLLLSLCFKCGFVKAVDCHLLLGQEEVVALTLCLLLAALEKESRAVHQVNPGFADPASPARRLLCLGAAESARARRQLWS